MPASASIQDDTADLEDGDDEDMAEEIGAAEPVAENMAGEAAASAVEPIVTPAPSMPEPVAFPSPGPAPERSPVDAVPEQTAASPVDDPTHAAPVQPSEPNTPEQ